MAKTYQTPGQKQEQETENRPRKTVGVFEHHERTGTSKALLVILAIIALVVIIFLVSRLARGEEIQQIGGHQSGAINEAVLSAMVLPDLTSPRA